MAETDEQEREEVADGPLPEWAAGLNPRQVAFVAAYTGRHMGNKALAAKAAGVPGDVVSRSAWACHLLAKNDKVRAAVDTCMAALIMPDDEVRARLAAQARGNIEDFLAINGEVKLDLRKAKRLQALGLVQELKERRRRVKADDGPDGKPQYVTEIEHDVKLYSAQGALNILAEMGLKRKTVDLNARHRFTDLDETAVDERIAELEARAAAAVADEV